MGDRRAQLETELEALDEEQAEAVAAMVAVSDTSLIGWSTAKVRAATKLAAGSASEGSDESVEVVDAFEAVS